MTPTHYYRKRYPPALYRRPCLVLARSRAVRGAPRNVLVRFEDGTLLVTGWRALRRLSSEVAG